VKVTRVTPFRVDAAQLNLETLCGRKPVQCRVQKVDIISFDNSSKHQAPRTARRVAGLLGGVGGFFLGIVPFEGAGTLRIRDALFIIGCVCVGVIGGLRLYRLRQFFRRGWLWRFFVSGVLGAGTANLTYSVSRLTNTGYEMQGGRWEWSVTGFVIGVFIIARLFGFRRDPFSTSEVNDKADS
jgi:hypothetical protein